jgi:hypothetical protein
VKIILDTTSSDPHYNGDCDCAVVDLTPALVDQIQRRVELARRAAAEDADIYELYFWGSAVDFYDHSLVEACEEAVAAGTDGQEEDKNAAAYAWSSALEQTGHALLPHGVDLKRHARQRTECLQTIIRCAPPSRSLEFEIAWTAIPKHTDVYVTTHDLSLTVMDDLLAAARRNYGNEHC